MVLKTSHFIMINVLCIIFVAIENKLLIQATLLYPDMCNPDFCLNRIGRSLPIHVIPICIIRILPNPDRDLGYTSVRIKRSCLYIVSHRWIKNWRIGLFSTMKCKRLHANGNVSPMSRKILHLSYICHR